MSSKGGICGVTARGKAAAHHTHHTEPYLQTSEDRQDPQPTESDSPRLSLPGALELGGEEPLLVWSVTLRAVVI